MEKEVTKPQKKTPNLYPKPSYSAFGDARSGLKSLEKKNKELSHATKELEEKVKSLKQKTKTINKALPKVRASSAPPRELPTHPRTVLTERQRRGSIVASNVTSRIREREAEFQKQVQERDQHIGRLKERLKALSKRLSEVKEGQKDLSKLANAENGTELQAIIKQVTKERLQLERHLQIANDSLQRNNGVDLQRVLSLEQTNNHLKQQLDSLDLLQQEHKLVEIQYREKEEACKELLNTLKYKSALCEDLETQLAKVIEKNTELTIVNSDLQKKVVELQDVTAECETLKTTLTKVENEYSSARTEVHSLCGKVRNLESVLEEMHKAAENRREIEKQHKEALESLKKKQGELDNTATLKQLELIEQLKKKIEELESEKRVQNEKHTDLILEMAELKKYGPESIQSDMENPSDNLEIDEIMAKLEQDNKFLADLEKQRAEKKGESPLHRTSSAITDSGFLSQSSLNGSNSSPTARLSNSNPGISHSNGSLHKLPGMTKADKINLLNGSLAKHRESFNAALSDEIIPEKDGMIDIPGKGFSYVYIARYSYDPFQHSPNDSPEAELQVNAGDYILVWGEVDEDGFYDGELLDGRRGLVPSNFVEKLEGDDLTEFHQQVILGLGDCDDSVCTSIPQDLDLISSDEGTAEEVVPKKLYLQHQSGDVTSKTLPQYASCTDLDMTEDEGDSNGSNLAIKVPAPKQLTVEALQNKSIVITWNPPDSPVNKLQSYQVLVDGNVHSTVEATEKSLGTTVSGVDASLIHRISVKTIGINSKMSNESCCTMVIGKDAPLGPTGVKATKTTSTSCTLCWIPSNSNFMHAISVNNVEVKTVKPGVFRHTLAGLTPNSTYKVTVRAKNIKAAPYLADYDLKHLSSSVEIRTQPRGLPEAPVDVQVDKGPTVGTLLVTWLPVTINPSGTSNGAPVTGYVIYANNQRIKEINSGTADQAVIDTGHFQIKTVTMRTKSNEILSKDSHPCLVPAALKQDVSTEETADTEEDDETEPDEAERLNKTPKSLSKQRELVISYSGYPELDSDIGPSELSDIAEEPEDGLTDSEDRDSVTPQNGHRFNADVQPSFEKSKLYQPNYNALRQWHKPNLTSSQFSAQPLTTFSATSTTTTSSSSSTFRPTIHITNATVHSPVKTTSTANNNINRTITSLSQSPKERVRIFVALFDYDPQTMSPNPDGCDEELPFREGQLIKIYGDKDSDGFYWGEAGKKSGYVPCNMVSEVQVDDENVAEDLFRDPAGKSKALNGKLVSKVDDRWGDIYEDMPSKKKLALYDYDPTELSPNVDSEVELSFRTGDLILVYGEMDDDGFFMGELNGKRGLVPSNFLTDIPRGYDPRQLIKLLTATNLPNNNIGRDDVNSHQTRIIGLQKNW